MTTLKTLAIRYNRQAVALAKPSKTIDEDVFDNTYKKVYAGSKLFKKMMKIERREHGVKSN